MDKNNIKENLLRKISDRSIRVAIIGLGYVGLPLAVETANAGYSTTGFEVQESKVNMVNDGESYIKDISNTELRKVVSKGKLSATIDFQLIRYADFIAICVPTPLDAHQQPDINYVKNSAETIAKYLTKETIVVLESTTYPGTTEELIKQILEAGSGLKCGEDFFLGFSPERVDPGNVSYKTRNTPKVVGGIGKDATEVIANIYKSVLESDIYEVSSPATAEMVKMLENTYRNINIGLINELAIICNKMNINIWEVIEVAKTKPYGFQAFYPGPGVGGHCIPLDPYYLSWKAREYEIHTSMIESSMIINDRMPYYCAERVIKILNRYNKAISTSKILILGIAYKENIDDCRESPALKLIEILKEEGATIDFYDPWITEYKLKGQVYKGIEKFSENVIASYDLVIIATSHTNVDYELVQRNAKIIFDTRNAMKSIVQRNNIEVI